MTTSKLRKAAVFLAALPVDQAASLLARLLPEQAAAVSAEIAGLAAVEQEECESVAREFAAAGLSRSVEAPHETIAFPNPPQRTTSPFGFLHGVASEDLVALMLDEHPQTVALVVSHLPARQAADVLALLPADRQAAVVACIASMIEPPEEEIVRLVAIAVERRLHGPATIPIARGMSNVVKLFGSMRPATERKLLGGIAEADPDLYREIRRAMFGPIVAEAG